MQREKAKNNTQEKGFLAGALWIAFGGFVAKIIGALYRIPLTNLIGGQGIGLYQLVYPVYCLLLTVSATGIPSSIAKLTAERLGRGQNPKPLFRAAMKLFVGIGLAGTVVMGIVAPFLANAQGSQVVLPGYYALAPSVFLVSVISVFRGYFQGRNNMVPTALSEMIEQAVKVAFGLCFASLFRDNIAKSVVFLLLAVSISELVTALVMWVIYCKKNKRENSEKTQNDGGRVVLKDILRMSLPVTTSALLIPLSSLIDSVLAVRLLQAYTDNAVGLYGLFSGGAVTVINLPVSVCYGIAAASIPAVSKAKAQEKGAKNVRRKWLFSFGITALVALPAAAGLFYFADPIARLIFRNLQAEELKILKQLIQVFSLSAFTLSCAQTLAACLTAQGKPQYAALSMAVGMIAKTIVYTLLLKNPQNSIFGLAHATNIGYLLAFLLDFVYNLIISRRRKAA